MPQVYALSLTVSLNARTRFARIIASGKHRGYEWDEHTGTMRRAHEPTLSLPAGHGITVTVDRHYAADRERPQVAGEPVKVDLEAPVSAAAEKTTADS